MDGKPFPEDCAKQWEVLLLLLATEEKKLGITADSEVKTMDYFLKREGINTLYKNWLEQMKLSYAAKVTETDTAKKSEAVSLYWRHQGNDCFNKGLINESYKYYSKSVLYAELKGKMYPLGLANRAAALIQMKRFEESLDDIVLALAHGYPEEQYHKLFLRQTDCFIKLYQPDKARVSLELAKQYLDGVNLPPNQKTEFDSQVKTMEAELLAIKDNFTSDRFEVLPTYLVSENINFVGASTSLAIRDGEQGRYVVTETAAQRGDYFFDEKAYAIVALPIDGNRAIVCETCFSEDINAIPCKECSRSVYCSEGCRDEGWKTFHQWECVGAQALLFPTIGIAHLALRVLLMSAKKGFPPIEKGKTTPLTVATVFKEYTRVDKKEIYKRGVPEFYRMFNLLTNFEKMPSMDFLQYALTATMLTLYLEHHTSFFEYLRSRLPYKLVRDDIKCFCAAMLFRHMGQLVCNGHAAQTLTVFIPNGEGFAGRTVCERELRYSTAIYPSAAMMNHSCDANIINTFYRDRLIIRCLSDIPAGGEVLNCYGPHKSRDTYAERRSQLYQQYCFECNCATCADVEWRDFSQLFSAFACQRCMGPVIRNDNGLKCRSCKTTEFDLSRAAEIMGRADDIMARTSKSSRQNLSENVLAVMKLKQQVLHKHNYEMRQTVDDLARFYTEDGNHAKSIELLKQNIQSCEYQYGSFSVEVAHELRKLADVMFERIVRFPQQPMYREWCMETKKVLKKAFQLMELNYGAWQQMVRHLREQEMSVEALMLQKWPPADSIHHNLQHNLKI